MKHLILVASLFALAITGTAQTNPPARHTEVSIKGESFFINGEPPYKGRTWKGRKIEGLLLHGNGAPKSEQIVQMAREVRSVPGYRPMPVIFNEDDHFGFDKETNNFTAAVGEYASWGYFDFRKKDEGFDEGYQSVPVNWGISSERKRGFFKLLSEIAGESPK